METEPSGDDRPDGATIELVVAGPRDAIRGFVAGFLAGEDRPDDAVLYADECGVACESFAERMAEWVHLRDSHDFLLVDDPLATQLENLIREVGKPLQIAVRERHVVRSASLRFHYDAYNRPLGDRLDALIRELAGNLQLSPGYSPTIEQCDEAKGPEMFSPLHDIAIHADGEFTGTVRCIFAARARLEIEEMVVLEPIRLQYDN